MPIQIIVPEGVLTADAQAEAFRKLTDLLLRLHGLTGDVAAEHHYVGPVDLPGVEELAKAHLRAVDIGGEEQLDLLGHDAQPATSEPRTSRTRRIMSTTRSGSTGFQV